MKPRKPPFVLITVLTLCLGTIAFVSMNYAKWTGMPEMEPPTPEQQVGESKKADSPDQIASAVSANSGMPKKMPEMPGGPGGGYGPGMSGRPSIFRPSFKPQKPKPSDSSVSSGWYRDNYGGAGSSSN